MNEYLPIGGKGYMVSRYYADGPNNDYTDFTVEMILIPVERVGWEDPGFKFLRKNRFQTYFGSKIFNILNPEKVTFGEILNENEFQFVKQYRYMEYPNDWKVYNDLPPIAEIIPIETRRVVRILR